MTPNFISPSDKIEATIGLLREIAKDARPPLSPMTAESLAFQVAMENAILYLTKASLEAHGDW